MSKPIIIWEKWRDPYGLDDLDHPESTDEDMETDGHEESQDNTSSTLPYELLSNIHNIKHKIPMMMTPMGLIPFTENTASSQIFNFWTGHSNFNITNKILSLIESIDGVESLDIFTRYRFRISVGKAFKDAEVMHSINNKVYSYLE